MPALLPSPSGLRGFAALPRSCGWWAWAQGDRVVSGLLVPASLLPIHPFLVLPGPRAAFLSFHGGIAIGDSVCTAGENPAADRVWTSEPETLSPPHLPDCTQPSRLSHKVTFPETLPGHLVLNEDSLLPALCTHQETVCHCCHHSLQLFFQRLVCLAVVGLCRCTPAFFSCGERGATL